MSSICFCIANRNKLTGAIFQKRKHWVLFVVSFFFLNTVTFSKVKTRVHFRCNNCTFSTEPFKIYHFAYILSIHSFHFYYLEEKGKITKNLKYKWFPFFAPVAYCVDSLNWNQFLERISECILLLKQKLMSQCRENNKTNKRPDLVCK